MLLATISILLFTDFVSDPKLRYRFGEYFTGMVATNSAINLIVLIVTLLLLLKLSVKQTWHKYKAKFTCKRRVKPAQDKKRRQRKERNGEEADSSSSEASASS